MRRLAVISIFMMLCTSLVWGQQQFQGNITTDTRWSGMVLLNGDVQVAKGATLTIMPGTRVMVAANSDATNMGKDPQRVEIVVKGKLLAQGELANKIIFTSNSPNPQMHDWSGIVIKNPREISVIDNCVIEYAYKGVTCFGSGPIITNNEIRYNLYAAISCEVRSHPRIRKNTISGNDFTGIACELASNPIIEQNIITQNNNGVIIFDRSNPDLGSIPLTRNSSRGENLILNNFESNIYNHSGNDISAKNNLWNTADSDQIISTLFDQNQNPSKGEVVFSPVFESGNPLTILAANTSAATNVSATPVSNQQQTTPVNTAANNVANNNNTPPATNDAANTTIQNPQANRQTTVDNTPLKTRENEKVDSNIQPVETQNNLVDNSSSKPAEKESQPAETNLANNITNNNATSDQSSVQKNDPPATNGAANTTTTSTNNNAAANVASTTNSSTLDQMVAEKTTTGPAIVEPIIEALLDSGSRQYITRVKPDYPSMYMKTGHQGKVLMEVLVDRAGNIESYRILKSDGDLFASAAEKALKRYKYKPGTHKGQPVKFKVVEPFIFRLRK